MSRAISAPVIHARRKHKSAVRKRKMSQASSLGAGHRCHVRAGLSFSS